ncbi:MAG: hypothetical protein QOI68_98, partial [Pseudonocardiales bacterium]|nr:hypothetical protein [Pseudonocardiales bacterium]
MLMSSTLASPSAAEKQDHPEWFATRWLSGGPEPSPTGWVDAVDSAGAGIALVAEPGHVNSFLVVGSRRAVLFDTGMGIRPMLPTLDRLTSLPFTVVNSHDHFDHRGGNHELSEHAEDIAVHPAASHGHHAAPADFYPGYQRAAARAAALFDRFAALDR